MEPTDKEKLENVLNELGLNSFQLAKELNITPSAIYHVISGKNKLSMKIISAIVKSFPQINKNYLIKGTNPIALKEKTNESDDFIIVKKQDFEQIKQDIKNIYNLIDKNFNKK